MSPLELEAGEIETPELPKSVQTTLTDDQIETIQVKADLIRGQIKERGKNEKVFDTSIPLGLRILEHMKTRMLFAEELCLLPIASIGGHLGDIQQSPCKEDDYLGLPGGKDTQFFFYKGDPEFLNIPVVFVMPPGLSKTWVMRKFFDRRSGICPIRSAFRGNITEAGFIAKQEGKGQIIPGDAYDYRTGFLLFNEISNIFISSETQHSGTLKNQVMDALSERHVSKRLGSMNISYDTAITIWGGIQNVRFNFSEGLGRRFAYATRSWTQEDIQMLKDDRLMERLNPNKNVRVNMEEVRFLRKEMAKVFNEGCIEKQPIWDESFLRAVHKRAATHTEMSMAERIVVGMAYMNQEAGDKVLRIKDEPIYRMVLDAAMKSKESVSSGGDFSLIVSALGDKKLTYEEAWKLFNRGFSYQLHQFTELWRQAKHIGLIKESIDEEKGTVFSVNKGMK